MLSKCYNLKKVVNNMRVSVLYRSNSEQERSVIEFEKEFERRLGRSLEMLDVNTREGASMASLYDIMRYPAVLAISNEGSIIHSWDAAESMPLINEVSYYTITN